MEKNIKQIKIEASELIENNEIRKTLDYLNNNITITNKDNRLSYLVHVEARFNDLLRNDALGIITQENFQVRKNKIKYGLSLFIDKLDDPNAFLVNSTFSEFESVEDINRKILKNILAIVILILIGVIFIIFKLY